MTYGPSWFNEAIGYSTIVGLILNINLFWIISSESCGGNCAVHIDFCGESLTKLRESAERCFWNFLVCMSPKNLDVCRMQLDHYRVTVDAMVG